MGVAGCDGGDVVELGRRLERLRRVRLQEGICVCVNIKWTGIIYDLIAWPYPRWYSRK